MLPGFKCSTGFFLPPNTEVWDAGNDDTTEGANLRSSQLTGYKKMKTIQYGFTMQYTCCEGLQVACGVDGAETLDEAIRESVDMAKRDGWKPAKWWEFGKRRWETKIDPKYL